MLPTVLCPHTRTEWFLQGTEPKQADTWYRRQAFDVTTGKFADKNTPPNQIVEQVVLDLPPVAREWAREQGWPLYEPPSGNGDIAGGPTPIGSPCSDSTKTPCSAVVILQPDPGSIYRISKQLPRSVQRIPVEVRVDDMGVQRVEVIVDGTQIMAEFASPAYSGFWPLQAGDHSFVARAHFKDGTSQDSAPIMIHVAE
jgi:hypothetical protein